MTLPEHTPALDQGLPTVSSAKSGLGRAGKIAAAIAILGAVGAAAYAAVTDTGEEERDPKRPLTIASNVPSFEAMPERGTVESDPVAVPPPPEPFIPPLIEAPVVVPEATGPSPEELEREARRRAPFLIFQGTGPGAQLAATNGNGSTFEGDELSAKLTATPMPGVTATRLADSNLMLTRGSMLQCSLLTAIDTTQPGLTSCILARDVFSANGKVLLVEKGSKITGQYQGGIKHGQARIFVLWSRIETPNGILVDLDSPGTDALGRSGHEGYVDGHFWRRFGSTMLLSIIDDVIQIAGNRIPGGRADSQIDLSNTSGSAKDTASIALENSINIPPTLYKNQGEAIAIFVARDLDFRGVYELRRRMASTK